MKLLTSILITAVLSKFQWAFYDLEIIFINIELFWKQIESLIHKVTNKIQFFLNSLL